ncbi:MAG: hypothetical protein PHH70_03765 [Candidatus Gracilibacteria bacterium]|nr:hypothetical protein [Candidatus Gracilibacteria bacterium]
MDTKEQQKKGYRKGYLVGYSPLRVLVLLGMTPVLLVGVLYATGLFSSLPSNPPTQPPGGTFSGRLANIASVSCPTTPVKHFVKGFDGDYKPVCVPYNAPTTGNANVATGSFSAPVAGGMPGGKFGTYFNNILNYCSGNGVLKGFTSQGQKICVNASDRTSTITPAPASLGASSIAYPTALPSGTSSGGAYQSFFDTMFSTSCGANQGVTGFGSNGAPVCAIMPLDGMCGSSNGQSYYTAPTTGLCSAGNASVSGQWNWTCNGSYGGGSVSCGANILPSVSLTRSFDSSGQSTTANTYNLTSWSWTCSNGQTQTMPVGYSTSFHPYTWLYVNGWSPGTHTCTYTLNGPGGTVYQNETFTIPSYAICGTTGNTCNNGTPSGYSAGSCGGNQGWTCNATSGPAVSCGAPNAACPINGMCNNSAQWGCYAGSPSGGNGSTACNTTLTWSCLGSNGGSNASCSRANVTCAPVACSGSTPCGSPGSCYAKTGCDNTCGSTKANDCAGTCGGSAVDYNGASVGCGSMPVPPAATGGCASTIRSVGNACGWPNHMISSGVFFPSAESNGGSQKFSMSCCVAGGQGGGGCVDYYSTTVTATCSNGSWFISY